MSNNNGAKLNVVGLGLSLGTLFGLGIFLTGFFSVLGFGGHFARMITPTLGFNISTFSGVCSAAFWTFVFAFIHGVLIATFYNFFSQKKNSR